MFFAIGGIDGKEADGKVREAEFGTIYTSKDGERWEEAFKGGVVTETFDHANCNLLRCLTFGNGLFVATGNAKNVLVSKDGRAWEAVPGENGSMSVAFGDGRFVMPTPDVLRTSEDGRHWTRHEMTPRLPVWGKGGAGHVRKIVFGGGRFVCVGGTFLGVTRDCKTWEHHQIFDADGGQQSLMYGAGRFIWLREKSPHLTSDDGLKWTEFAVAGEDRPSFDGLWTGSEFLIAGNQRRHRSKDGIAWTTEKTGYDRPVTASKETLLHTNWPKGLTISTDFGRAWRKIVPDLSARQLYYFDGVQIIGQNGG